jgi:hypothetical protein
MLVNGRSTSRRVEALGLLALLRGKRRLAQADARHDVAFTGV